MRAKRVLPSLVALVALVACGQRVPESAVDAQAAQARYDKETPIMFGGAVPTVKSAKCTHYGAGAYNCALVVSGKKPGDADQTLQVRMTQLNGEWRVEVTSLF